MSRNSATWTTWKSYGSDSGAGLISDPTAFSWLGGFGDIPSFGVIYRTGNDVNQIADFTLATPPTAPRGAKAKSSTTTKSTTKASSTPEFHTYTTPK